MGSAALVVRNKNSNAVHSVDFVSFRSVTITFDALPNTTLRGTVESIVLGAGAGAGGTTFKLIIAFGETDPRLRWGMTAFLDIETE